MAIHPFEMQFYREQQKILADTRAREQQKAKEWEASRQRQRDHQYWTEHAASLKRRMEVIPRPRQEPPVLVRGHARGFAVPAGNFAVSAGPARKSRPSLCLDYKTLNFMERWIWRAVAFVLCVYAALVFMPPLYASDLNRDLVAFGVSHGVPALAALIAACIAEFLLL